MAARTTNNPSSVEALEKELAQLERRLEKARADREKNSETLVNKLRRGLDAARKKERTAREKVRTVRAKKKTPAQQCQLDKARQQLTDARGRTEALTLEMREAQTSYRGFKSDNKLAAQRAKLLAKHSAEYDKKVQKAQKHKASTKTRARKTSVRRKAG